MMMMHVKGRATKCAGTDAVQLPPMPLCFVGSAPAIGLHAAGPLLPPAQSAVRQRRAGAHCDAASSGLAEFSGLQSRWRCQSSQSLIPSLAFKSHMCTTSWRRLQVQARKSWGDSWTSDRRSCNTHKRLAAGKCLSIPDQEFPRRLATLQDSA